MDKRISHHGIKNIIKAQVNLQDLGSNDNKQPQSQAVSSLYTRKEMLNQSNEFQNTVPAPRFAAKFKAGATSNRIGNNYKNGIHKIYGSPSKYSEKFYSQNKLQLYMQDHTNRVRESSKRKANNSILSNTNTITDLSISNDVSLKEHKIKNISKIITKPRRKKIGKDKSFSSRPSVGHEAKKSVASSVKGEDDQSKMMKSTLDQETLHKMHDLKENFEIDKLPSKNGRNHVGELFNTGNHTDGKKMKSHADILQNGTKTTKNQKDTNNANLSVKRYKSKYNKRKSLIAYGIQTEDEKIKSNKFICHSITRIDKRIDKIKNKLRARDQREDTFTNFNPPKVQKDFSSNVMKFSPQKLNLPESSSKFIEAISRSDDKVRAMKNLKSCKNVDGGNMNHLPSIIKHNHADSHESPDLEKKLHSTSSNMFKSKGRPSLMFHDSPCQKSNRKSKLINPNIPHVDLVLNTEDFRDIKDAVEISKTPLKRKASNSIQRRKLSGVKDPSMVKKDPLVPTSTVNIDSACKKSKKKSMDTPIMPVNEFKSHISYTSKRNKSKIKKPSEKIGEERKRMSKPSTAKSKKSIQCSLTDHEKKIYGNRCPEGYQRVRLLGKGGCALVWLVKDVNTEAKYALKQFPKNQESYTTAQTEVKIFKQLNSSEFSDHPGHGSISHLIERMEDKKDIFLLYEVGGTSFTDSIFKVKGEFYKSERIYFINHLDLYHAIKGKKSVLKQLLVKLFEAFDLLQLSGVIHADVKSDNILVTYQNEEITDVKLIDFGSAFVFEEAKGLSLSTPEYLAPEVLSYLENKGKQKQKSKVSEILQSMKVWSYDMWSIGALLLEIITGFPIWMSLKCRTKTKKGKQIFGKGIFGVQGRDCGKIYLKQKQFLMKDLQASLKKYDTCGLQSDLDFLDLLRSLLEFNPKKRISPSAALEHPFIANN
ncbi:unnamed protein product [Moneuplotes crassus]|uniref:Protein kinase domain-containing protein n=1 Tax=Euplotes crassus TaxID=5936 RepID=A0AAD1XZM3_EUPCR|nr:unnamed protein product [Moneuplotes crassus]